MCITEHHLLNNENSFTVLISKTDFNRRCPGRMGHRFISSIETDDSTTDESKFSLIIYSICVII